MSNPRTLNDLHDALAARRTFHAPYTLAGGYAALVSDYVAVLSYGLPDSPGESATGELRDDVIRSARDLNDRYMGRAPAIAEHDDAPGSADRRALYADEVVYYVTARISGRGTPDWPIVGYVTAGGESVTDEDALARAMTPARADAVRAGLATAARRQSAALANGRAPHDARVFPRP